MKNMMHHRGFAPAFLFGFALLPLGWTGCDSSQRVAVEEADPSYERGRAHLRHGREEEALDEFLSVTRRLVESPQSHLEAGRLLMKVENRFDPVSAIYHYRRFLELSPDSKESSTVEQLIVTAEREIIRKLPGEPYANHLETLRIKEENQRLEREIADLRVRLGQPVGSLADAVPPPPGTVVPGSVAPPPPNSSPPPPTPSPGPASEQTYVVRQGDSLYAISRKFYGDSAHIDLIFNANRDVLPGKNSLKIGQTLRIPPVPRR